MRRYSAAWAAAFCGIGSALSIVLLLLGAVFPSALFIAPAAAGFLTEISAEECGVRMAWTQWGAVSLLGLLFVPDKEVVLLYTVLLGYYPLIRYRFDRISSRVFRGAAKLVLCDAAVLLLYGMLFLLFPYGAAASEWKETAFVMMLLTVIVGDIAFLLFDKALVNLMRVYRLIWQPRLHKMTGQ